MKNDLTIIIQCCNVHNSPATCQLQFQLRKYHHSAQKHNPYAIDTYKCRSVIAYVWPINMYAYKFAYVCTAQYLYVGNAVLRAQGLPCFQLPDYAQTYVQVLGPLKSTDSIPSASEGPTQAGPQCLFSTYIFSKDIFL